MIPIADETDESAYQASPRNGWRTFFSGTLSGTGLELGALHKPMVKHDNMKVIYVDHLPVEELRKHYPEFNHLPLVEPDIIADAQTLLGIGNNKYDFVIASHVIEHMSCPLRAIRAWLRVLKPGGKLYIVVPDKRAIFDRKRARTTLAHVVSDFKFPDGRSERDWEHYLDYALNVDNDIHFEGKLDALGVIAHAQKLKQMEYSLHYHCWLPVDFTNILEWYRANIHDFTILHSPTMTRGDSEFGVLCQKL